MEKIVNDVITLRDSKSFLRKNLFRLFAINSIDGMEFYYFMGEMAQRPIVGKAAKMLMTSYYKHVHTNAVKLPLKDIEDVINNCETMCLSAPVHAGSSLTRTIAQLQSIHA